MTGLAAELVVWGEGCKLRWLWSHEMAGKLMDNNEVNSKIFDGEKGGWQP